MTVMYRKVSVFVTLMLTVSGISACSLFGGEEVKVRPIETMSGLTNLPRDALYESAVTAINARDYGRALDYLQEAKARDPRNVKALNALGVVYDKLGRFDLSARYYAQARAVEPESRIVAENIGYSAVLQNLLHPGQQTAIATIKLPADLNNASPEKPPMVLAASPTVVAPSVMPQEKQAWTSAASSTPLVPVVPASDEPKHAVVVPEIVPLVKIAAGVSPVTAPATSAAKVPAKKSAQKQAAGGPVVQATLVSVPTSANGKKVFVIGHPVKILNASGKRERVGAVSRRLGMLGWTVRPSDARRIQPVTTLFYPKQNDFAAKAMQRTLPFPVRLVDAGSGSAMTLVIGQDYLSWKPRNARLAALWQKGITVASLQYFATKRNPPMSRKRKCDFRVLLVCGLLGTVPAKAGLFDSAPPKPVGVSARTVSEIQNAFDDQRYLDASKILNQALLLSGSDPRLTYWAGQLSLARGRYEDALANFATIKSDPQLHGLALEGEGIAFAKLGRTDEAMTSLQAAVAADPMAWRAWNALGSEFDRRHDWSSAEAAYAHAISSSGGAAIALNNRGFSRLSQKKPDLAILDFVAALQKKPDLAPARNNLRLAMSMQGEYDRAIKGAAAADQAAVLNNAGFAAMLRGDYAKAKELLTQAMKIKGGYYALAAANLETTQNLTKAQAGDTEHASSR